MAKRKPTHTPKNAKNKASPKPFLPIIQSTPMPVRRLTYNEITISSISPVPRHGKSQEASEVTRYSASMSLETPNGENQRIEVVHSRKRTDGDSQAIEETLGRQEPNAFAQLENYTDADAWASQIVIKEEMIEEEGSQSTIVQEISETTDSEATPKLMINEVHSGNSAQNVNNEEDEQSDQESVNSIIPNLTDGAEEIFFHPDNVYDSDSSSVDSFWTANPYDKLPNFRLRNQSLQNTFTKANEPKTLEVVQRPKRGRPKMDKNNEKAVDGEGKVAKKNTRKKIEKTVEPVKKVPSDNPTKPPNKPAQKKTVKAIVPTEKVTSDSPTKSTRKTAQKKAQKAVKPVEKAPNDNLPKSVSKTAQKKAPEKIPSENPPKSARKITQKKAENAQESPELPNENYDMLSESEIVPKIRVRKSIKAPETVKKSRKRKSSEKVTDEPEKKLRESTSSHDEGFHDDSVERDEDFDVKYVPDNTRYSLRKRRYMKAWWINGGKSDQRYEIAPLTAKDVRAGEKLQKLKAKNKINLKKFAADPILNPPLTVQLKIAQEAVKEEKRLTKLKSQSSKEKSMKISVKEKNPSKAIANAFEKLSSNDGFSAVEIYENFATAQLDQINWEEVCPGVLNRRFLAESDDQFLKILPGASMKNGYSSTVEKFTILCGNVLFTIGGVTKEVKGFGFIRIDSDIEYEIANIGDHDAVISLAVC